MKTLVHYILHRPVATAIGLLVMAAIVLFFRLGSTPIYILDEARNAQCAREMMQRHDWIVPTFNGELRTHKPPLHYYFMWGSYKLFGVNPFGARFPSVLMGLLTLALSWWFIQKFSTARIAMLALLTMVLSTHFLFEFRMAVPDPYLIFFTTAGMFCFYAWVQDKRTYWLIFSAVAMALAALSKGPVALALPGLSIITWLIVERKIKLLLNWKLLLAAAVFLSLALPWYIMVHNATGGAFTRGFFLEHNIQRFNEPMEGHGGFFLLVPLFVWVGLLPFSVFLISFFRKLKFYFPLPMVSFSLVAATVFILFFSISGTKLPNYPMPCYPFVSLLIAYVLNSAIESGVKWKGTLIFLLIIAILLLTGAVAGFQLDASLRPLSYWTIIFMVPVAGIGLAVFNYRKGVAFALALLGICYLIFNLLGLGLLYPAIYRNNPVAATIDTVKQSKKIFAYQVYNPSFNFYIDQTIQVFHTRVALEKALQQSNEAVIITRQSSLSELEGLPLKVIRQMKDPLETPTTVILRYR